MKAKSLFINFIVLLTAMLVALVSLELFLRISNNQLPWPGYKAYPVSGILHDKALQGINSFGFMDVQRQVEKPSDCYRVILLGDSFVDGMPIASKLEKALQNKIGNKKVEVVPMGISGTGTVNELVFLEQFGLALKPDLVVVLFVPNDFANNSNLLEAVRLRFNPFKPGRPFLWKSSQGIQRIDASTNFEQFLLAELPPHPQQGLLRLPEAFLEKNLGASKLYQFIRAKLNLLDTASLYHRFDGEFAYRLSQMKCMPGVADSIEGWHYPQDLDMDAMFLADGEAIPKVFHDALDYSVFALRQFNSYANAGGFHFLLVATDSCTYFPPSWLKEWNSVAERAKRTIDPNNFIRRVNGVAKQAGVDFLDLYPVFSKLSDIRDGHLPNDNHWSDFGQTVAAQGIADDVAARGWLD